MFSFHRPKVYRSSTGCCICKAKSSSSRFTDSKKYEEDFLECFKLSTPRQGEICNACVLLVKRWKKLPAGSDRNWQHVVDARAGPGIKSMTKFKVKNRKHRDEKMEKIKSKKLFVREDSPVLSDKSEGNEEGEYAEVDYLMEDGRSGGSSRADSPGASDCEEVVERNRRYSGLPKQRRHVDHVSDFVDSDYWKRETICCGTILRGLFNEIMVDPRYLKPCRNRLAFCKLGKNKQEGSDVTDNSSTKVYSDSSSDSGYDESSNQGLTLENNAFKKDQVSIEINSQNSKEN